MRENLNIYLDMANQRFTNFENFEAHLGNSREFYVRLNSMCDKEATQETEILNHFVSEMLHRSSPNSVRRARTLMKLAPKIETENKKYIKERMYKKLAAEAESAVFGKPHVLVGHKGK